jgi:hypothetical protein
VLSSLVARFGVASLVTTLLLIIAWLFLTALSIQTPLGNLNFTFWQVLGFLNSSNVLEGIMQGGRNQPGAGFYGFLALVAIAGPFLRYFWTDRRAILGGVLPLLFMGVVGIMVRSSLESTMGGDATGAFGVAMKQMRDEAMSAISLGFGAYLSGLVSLYLAAVSAKRFLAGRATEKREQQESTHRAAA